MTTFNEPQEELPNKVIYLGHFGAGKTGSLASLAAAGYNVRILDADKKTQILRDYMLNTTQSIYRRAAPGLWTAEQAAGTAGRLSFVSLDETMALVGAKGKERYVPKGDLWGKAMSLMNDWEDPPRSFGNIGTWGPQDVLVLDGLSRLSQAAMDQQLALSGNIANFGSKVGRLPPQHIQRANHDSAATTDAPEQRGEVPCYCDLPHRANCERNRGLGGVSADSGV